MVVGLRNGSIYESSTGDYPIMASHCDGEVWGLDISSGMVVTSGDDNQIIVWDPVKHCRV
jgi:hypothetical protein